jgi:Cdc6-like AAA superfamily ATPase
MYLCGHPGTGKTSALNSVLQMINQENDGNFELFMYNAMAFNDVKNFGLTLYRDL